MDILFVPLLAVLAQAINLYKMFLFAFVILSWLEAFGVINSYNRFVYSLNTFLFRIIEPVLSPIRRFVPSIGGFDLSPIILLFILHFIQGVLVQIISKFPS
jgi:YggT family protein